MQKKSKRSLPKARVPLSWRLCTGLAMIPLAMSIFLLIFRAAGGKFPPAAGRSTDPYFFGLVFALALPILVWLYVDRILQGIIMKRSGREIAVDVAKDLACNAAAMVAEIVLDAAVGGSSANSGSSSTGGTSGKGGKFGGGGASGGGLSAGGGFFTISPRFPFMVSLFSSPVGFIQSHI